MVLKKYYFNNFYNIQTAHYCKRNPCGIKSYILSEKSSIYVTCSELCGIGIQCGLSNVMHI